MRDDAAMAKVREIWARLKAERMTQEELGVRMGYDRPSARKSVSQFLKTKDPRVGMLRKFSRAVGVPLAEIIAE